MPPGSLATYLCRFHAELRKKDGSLYTKNAMVILRYGLQFDVVLYYIFFTSAILERQNTKQRATGALVNVGNYWPSVGLGQYFPNFGSVIYNIDLDASHYLYNSSRLTDKPQLLKQVFSSDNWFQQQEEQLEWLFGTRLPGHWATFLSLMMCIIKWVGPGQKVNGPGWIIQGARAAVGCPHSVCTIPTSVNRSI